MASSPSLVYPEVCGWNPSGTDREQKPVLTSPIPRRASQAFRGMSRTSTPRAVATHPTDASQSQPRKVSRSRRGDDAGRIKRPRNCFFIFRCEYTKRHQEAAADSNRPPTPEKTLSKRAGAVWKAMTDLEKKRFRDQAKQESREHAEMNPGYKYSPQRTKAPRRRHTGSVSRREQVETLVQMRESSAARSFDSTSDISAMDSPLSHTSSSPEPAGPSTPTESHHHGLAHRRSMSLPHLDMAHPAGPYPYAHTYFIQPASCSSSPGPGPHRTNRRASSVRQRSYSPSVASIPPPDPAFDLEFGNVTIPFASLAPHTSTMSLPELLSLPDLSISDDGSSTFSTPQISPATSLHDLSRAEYFPMQSAPAASSAPLIHRRQRSNTAPSSTISPLAMLSSSLSNWNGEGQSSIAGPSSTMPSLTISPPDPSLSLTSASLPNGMPLPDYTFPPTMSYASDPSSSTSSLLAPSADLDFDRTPRRSDFPSSLYVPEPYYDYYAPAPAALGGAPMADPLVPAAAAFAMESYQEGLGAYDIAPAIYDMSPFDDVDFSDFIHASPHPEHAAPALFPTIDTSHA